MPNDKMPPNVAPPKKKKKKKGATSGLDFVRQYERARALRRRAWGHR